MTTENQTLQQLLAERVTVFANGDRPREIIDKAVEAMFVDVIKDAFRSYGDPGKAVQEAIKAAMPANVGDVFELIAAGKLECQPRSMLEVTGDFGDGISTRYAVNEVVIQRQGAGMISVETYVNDQMVATYHGDGLIVSTPTGSTAYSLSVGGPVVAPQCACLVLSPVAPHNLTMRPVVIPSSSDVRLKVHARHAEISIATDNETCPIPEGAEFRVRLASRRFFLAVPHNISFYDTLRKKMMWGVDIRS